MSTSGPAGQGSRLAIAWTAALLLGGAALLQTWSRLTLEDHAHGLAADGAGLVERVKTLEDEATVARARAAGEAKRRARSDADRATAAASILAARAEAYDLGFLAARQAFELGDHVVLEQRLTALPVELRGFEHDHLAAVAARRLRRLSGHQNAVYCLTASVDGTRLASGGYDDLIRVWDVERGAEVRALAGHEAEILSVAMSADGTRVASSADDDTVRLWSVPGGGEEQMFTMEERAWSVALDGAGQRLAVGTDGGAVLLFDVQKTDGGSDGDGAELGALALDHPVQAVAIDGAGALVVVGDEGGVLHLWRPNDGLPPIAIEAHEEWIVSVAVSVDGNLVATAAGDGSAALWRAADGTRVGVIDEEGGVLSLAFTPDGARLIVGTGGGLLRVRDAQTLAPLAFVAPALDGAPIERIERVVAAAGGRVAFTAGDDDVRLWEAAPTPPRLVIEVGGGAVGDARFSADGTKLAVGSEDGAVRVYDTIDGTPLQTLEGQATLVRSLALAPSGVLVTGDRKGQVALWRELAAASRRVVTPEGPPVEAVRFTPDGTRFLVATNDGAVRVHDTADGSEVAFLPGTPHGRFRGGARPVRRTQRLHRPRWNGACFRSADGRAAHGVARARAWSRQPPCPITARPLARGGLERTRAAPLEPGGRKRPRDPPAPRGGYVEGLAFSEDGRRLALGSSNDVVQLVDVATGFELLRLQTDVGGIRSLAFGHSNGTGDRPKGVRLAVSGAAGRVEIWE